MLKRIIRYWVILPFQSVWCFVTGTTLIIRELAHAKMTPNNYWKAYHSYPGNEEIKQCYFRLSVAN